MADKELVEPKRLFRGFTRKNNTFLIEKTACGFEA